MTDVYNLFTVPAGTKVSEVKVDDPLIRRYQFEQPDATIKTLEIGPDGLTLCETAMAADFTFSVGNVSNKPLGELRNAND
jgi:hypothetical protein